MIPDFLSLPMYLGGYPIPERHPFFERYISIVLVSLGHDPPP